MLIASSPPSRRRTSRFLSSLALMLSGVLAFYIVLHNYRAHAAEENHWMRGSPDLASQGAPIPTDSKTQAALEAVANKYAIFCTHGDFGGALALTCASYRQHQSLEGFRRMTQQAYQPFTQCISASKNHFSHAYSSLHLTLAMVKMELHCRNGKNYITMLSFTREGKAWRISNILPLIYANSSAQFDYLFKDTRI